MTRLNLRGTLAEHYVKTRSTKNAEQLREELSRTKVIFFGKDSGLRFPDGSEVRNSNDTLLWRESADRSEWKGKE